jgi:hypothetical protein
MVRPITGARILRFSTVQVNETRRFHGAVSKQDLLNGGYFSDSFPVWVAFYDGCPLCTQGRLSHAQMLPDGNSEFLGELSEFRFGFG